MCFIAILQTCMTAREHTHTHIHTHIDCPAIPASVRSAILRHNAHTRTHAPPCTTNTICLAVPAGARSAVQHTDAHLHVRTHTWPPHKSHTAFLAVPAGARSAVQHKDAHLHTHTHTPPPVHHTQPISLFQREPDQQCSVGEQLCQWKWGECPWGCSSVRHADDSCARLWGAVCGAD